MDRGLADLLGTDIRDAYNTGRISDPSRIRRTRYGIEDPVMETRDRPSLLEDSARNRSASPQMEAELQAWQQKKWDKEESSMNKEEGLNGILDIMKNAGMKLSDLHEFLKSAGAEFSDKIIAKEPWE